MIRFLLQLTKETHERLRQLAFKRNTSMSEEARKAIDEYLRKESDNNVRKEEA